MTDPKPQTNPGRRLGSSTGQDEEQKANNPHRRRAAAGRGTASQRDVITQILSRLRADLLARNSPLIREGELDAEFRRNVVSILDEVCENVAGDQHDPEVALSVDYSATPSFLETGRLRAEQNLHPAESLMAAELLFHDSLPVLARDQALGPDTVEDAIRIAGALHHAIWRRFPPGAIAYAEALRQRLAATHRESRLRLSRDLHDRIAHGIASGIQRIELAALDMSEPSELDRAAAILRSTLDDVQDLAVELRSRVGELNIEDALRQHLADTTPFRPTIELETSGTARKLAPWLEDEIFTIVVEAIRNARAHAPSATQLDLTIQWTLDELEIRVVDNGAGFRYEDVQAGSLGLLDMAERADAIGGSLRIDSTPGAGTSIELTVPIDSEAVR